MHKLKYEKGSDARNHIVRCGCGWAHSNTLLAARARGLLHLQAFDGEFRKWSDPDRLAVMPAHPH